MGIQAPPNGRSPAATALVIGAGFGGLAAAVRLGARGYRVTVLEARDAPGGRAYVYRQDGFTFDGGPTIITAPFLFEELWTLCGRRMADDVELRALSPFYRIRFDDGDVFDVSGDEASMHAEIARVSSADLKGYGSFMRASEAIYRVGFEQLGHVPFDSPLDMLRILPAMVKLRSYRTIHDLASAHFESPKLRFIFSFHPLFVGGNPFTTTSVYGLIAFLERRFGVHCAIGGTGRLVDGLVRLVESQAGEVRCNAKVREIIVENGHARGVRLSSGEEIRADIVVSNADSSETYRKLVPERARRHWSDRRLDHARYSMGLFVWYFGTRRQFPDVPHHTILVGPRYRELLEDIFEHKILASDFSLYLHRPTATDPSLAPEGCDTFYVLSPVPNLAAAVDWRERAEPYRREIARHLDATMLPGFEAEDRLVPDHDAPGVPGQSVEPPRRGVRAGAAPDAERVVPASQPQRGRPGPVPRGSRNSPRGRSARRPLVCEGARLHRPCPCGARLISHGEGFSRQPARRAGSAPTDLLCAGDLVGHARCIDTRTLHGVNSDGHRARAAHRPQLRAADPPGSRGVGVAGGRRPGEARGRPSRRLATGDHAGDLVHRSRPCNPRRPTRQPLRGRASSGRTVHRGLRGAAPHPRGVSPAAPRPAPRLSVPLLLVAFQRHAWTFAGNGQFSFRGPFPGSLTLAGCPTCRPASGAEFEGPAGAYYEAAFEGLLRLAAPGLRVREAACQAMHAPLCRFEISFHDATRAASAGKPCELS